MFSWYSLQMFLKLLVTIPVAPIITGTIVHFRFHIRCISIHKLLYFNLLLLLLLQQVGVNSAGNVLSRTHVMQIPGASGIKTHCVTWQTKAYI